MEVIVEEVQIATACQYADLTGGTQSAPCRFAHAKSHNLGAPTTSRNFNGSNLSHRRNFAGDRNREIVVPCSMINQVWLSFCRRKTVLRTSQAPHSHSLVGSDGTVHSDRGYVHVVSQGDQDPVMLWAVNVVEKLRG